MSNQRHTIVFIAVLFLCLITSLPTFTGSNRTATTAQASTASLPVIEWNATFGLGHYNTAHQIIQTKDGGYAVSGMYGSQNPLNVTLVKLDANGNVQWNQSYDLQFINYPLNSAIIQTNDSGYVIIGNQYGTLTLTLIKTDSEGQIQWSQTYPGNYLTWGMTQTHDGGYLITGTTSTLSIETQPKAVLIKTDASGKMQWSKMYGSSYSDFFHAVVQADDGNYVAVAGDRLVKVDASGNILWDKELPPALPSDPEQYRYSGNDLSALIKTADGGYVLAGRAFNENINGGETAFALIVKTDSAGTIQWNKTYGESGQIWPYAIVQTGDNGYALAGTASNDIILIKTDEDGNQHWTQTFGGIQSDDSAFSAIETLDGGFALAGQTQPGTTYSECYYYIVKTTPVSPSVSPTTSSSTGLPSLPLEILTVISAILIAIICLTILAIVKHYKHSNK